MQYIAPGLIMMSVISNSYGNVVSSFFGAKFGKHIEELLVAPLPNWLIVLGYVSGGVMRGLLVGAVVTVVTLFFTRLPVEHPLLVVGSVLLTVGRVLARRLVQRDLRQELRPDLVVPDLRADAADLPRRRLLFGRRCCRTGRERLSYLNPILYMVNAFRHGFLGTSDVDLGFAFLIMGAFAAAMFTVVVMLMNRGTGIRE